MTGKPLWKARPGEAAYAAPAIVNMGDQAGLLIFNAAGLSCLDPDDGKEFWSVPWKTNYKVNATTPVTDGTTVFITSGYGTGCQALKAAPAGAEVSSSTTARRNGARTNSAGARRSTLTAIFYAWTTKAACSWSNPIPKPWRSSPSSAAPSGK